MNSVDLEPKRGRAHRPFVQCPHCDERAFCRSSERLSSTYREITYACADVHCGHTFVAGLSIIRTLSPSAMPNPAINLPIAPPRARHKPANDNRTPAPPAANDDQISIEAG